MSDQTADIINFINQFEKSGDTKHLEQAKVAMDALWHSHRSKTIDAPTIQVVVNKMVKQCGNKKNDVFIKPSIKK